MFVKLSAGAKLLTLLTLLGCPAVTTPAAPKPPGAVASTTPSQRCGKPRYRFDPQARPLVIEALDDAPALEVDGEIRLDDFGDIDGDGREDAILFLGGCGNWGDCIYAIMLGCGDDEYVLAADPDYAQDFTVVMDERGVPTLWESTRGASGAVDDIGRQRWEIRDGRARRTDEWHLVQLVRGFSEPEPRATSRRTLDRDIDGFCHDHRCFGEGEPRAFVRAGEEPTLGLVWSHGDGVELVEELPAGRAPLDPRWVIVHQEPTQPSMCWHLRIDLAAERDGMARQVRVIVGDEITWLEAWDPGHEVP